MPGQRPLWLQASDITLRDHEGRQSLKACGVRLLGQQVSPAPSTGRWTNSAMSGHNPLRLGGSGSVRSLDFTKTIIPLRRFNIRIVMDGKQTSLCRESSFLPISPPGKLPGSL